MRRAVSLSFLGLLVLLALTRYPVPIYRDHTFLHFPVWEVAAKSEGFFFPLSNPYLNHGAQQRRGLAKGFNRGRALRLR